MNGSEPAAPPTPAEFLTAAGHIAVVVARRTERASRVQEGADAALLTRHAFLLAARARADERLSLPEIVALLQAAEICDSDGEPWTEASLCAAVRGAAALADRESRASGDPATLFDPEPPQSGGG